jgi:hypothetical protein
MQAVVPISAFPAPAADTVRSLLRVGAVALALGSLMVLSVLFAVNPPTDPAQNREWAVQANTAGYRLAWTIRVYSNVPLLVGLIAVFVALAGSAARQMALAGMLATVVAAGVALPGTGYFVTVVPAAGVRIAAGDEAPILRFLDQIFREPGWILFGLASLIYFVGWILMGRAIRRSGLFPRFTGEVAIALGVIGILTPLNVTVVTLAGAVLQAAVAAMLAVGLWRRTALTPS